MLLEREHTKGFTVRDMGIEARKIQWKQALIQWRDKAVLEGRIDELDKLLTNIPSNITKYAEKIHDRKIALTKDIKEQEEL